MCAIINSAVLVLVTIKHVWVDIEWITTKALVSAQLAPAQTAQTFRLVHNVHNAEQLNCFEIYSCVELTMCRVDSCVELTCVTVELTATWDQGQCKVFASRGIKIKWIMSDACRQSSGALNSLGLDSRGSRRHKTKTASARPRLRQWKYCLEMRQFLVSTLPITDFY